MLRSVYACIPFGKLPNMNGHESDPLRVVIHEHVEVRSSLKLRKYVAGQGKWVVQQVAEDSLCRKNGKWNYLHRVIDRDNDRYFERVTDRVTGAVIRECSERLTDHKGHGDDRKP